MQVDYLLYNDDYNRIDGMFKGLTACPDGLFNPAWPMRMQTREQHVWNGPEWPYATFIHFELVGKNVLRYNVTLPRTDKYPASFAALLIDHGWEVKVRYRNDEVNCPWTYMKCEFPGGGRYALPADCRE